MTILLLINLHDDTRQLGKVMENIANSSIRYYFALKADFTATLHLTVTV
jgi:hypothetical protein